MRLAGSRAIGLLAALTLLVGGATVARADKEDPDTEVARRHYENGLHLYDQNRYAEALEEFKAAQRAKPKPAHFWNIARCYDRLERLDEAIRAYQAYVDSDPRDAKGAKDARERVDILRVRRAQQAQPEPPPPPAPPVPVVGTPPPVVTTPDPPPPPPPPMKKPWWPWVVAGAAVAVAGVGVGVGLAYGLPPAEPPFSGNPIDVRF